MWKKLSTHKVSSTSVSISLVKNNNSTFFCTVTGIDTIGLGTWWPKIDISETKAARDMRFWTNLEVYFRYQSRWAHRGLRALRIVRISGFSAWRYGWSKFRDLNFCAWLLRILGMQMIFRTETLSVTIWQSWPDVVHFSACLKITVSTNHFFQVCELNQMKSVFSVFNCNRRDAHHKLRHWRNVIDTTNPIDVFNLTTGVELRAVSI